MAKNILQPIDLEIEYVEHSYHEIKKFESLGAYLEECRAVTLPGKAVDKQ